MRLRWLVEGIVLASRTQATTVKFSIRTPPSTVVQTSATPAVSMPPTKRRKAAPILSSLLCHPWPPSFWSGNLDFARKDRAFSFAPSPPPVTFRRNTPWQSGAARRLQGILKAQEERNAWKFCDSAALSSLRGRLLGHARRPPRNLRADPGTNMGFQVPRTWRTTRDAARGHRGSSPRRKTGFHRKVCFYFWQAGLHRNNQKNSSFQ